MLTTFLFWLFILAIVLQCSYALYFFARILFLPQEKKANKKALNPVSIIICAKNEAVNLTQNLPLILAQRYSNEVGQPMYEVIVVNDASEDATDQVLDKLEREYPNLKRVTISKTAQRNFKGKKFALSEGVRHSKYSILLLTDADCAPSSENWISFMVAPFDEGNEIVAGYGGYQFRSGFLNAFIRWETVHTFLQYATYALARKPYMAVGRNLACKKELFLKAEQSSIWNELPSGDDDLLMNICATKDNSTVVANPETFTFSPAKTNLKDWLSQKQRHLSTGKYYQIEIKALLGIYGLSHSLIWVLFFVLLFMKYWLTIILIMSLRSIIYWAIWYIAALKLKEKISFISLPFFDFGWMIYNLILSPYILWKNKQNWK